MKRSFVAATVYFLLVFLTGFVLGVFRVVYVAPEFGRLTATLIEAPLMVESAFFIGRWVLRHWGVPQHSYRRWMIAVWFLTLLFVFEWQLGERLFARGGAEQWEPLRTPTGLVGLSAQLNAAFFPVILGKPRIPQSP